MITKNNFYSKCKKNTHAKTLRLEMNYLKKKKFYISSYVSALPLGRFVVQGGSLKLLAEMSSNYSQPLLKSNQDGQ